MSSKVAFQVHYGDFYRITHDSYGVNLSALERRQCSLDKPIERSFESIRKYIHRMFNEVVQGAKYQHWKRIQSE